MNKTGIEWCTMTWNPLRGCSWASPGCDHCYAEALAATRLAKPGQPYHGVIDPHTRGWNGDLVFVEKKLAEPMAVKEPQLVFANSMGDICHPNVQRQWIANIMDIVVQAHWHFFLFLTKRPNLITSKFFTEEHPEPFLPRRVPPNTAMETSIEQEKFLWRGYCLIEKWPGSCFLSIEPLIRG